MKEIETLEKLKCLKQYLNELHLDESNKRTIKKALDSEIDYIENSVYLVLGKKSFEERYNK